MFDAKSLLDQVLGAAEKYAGKENIDKLKEKAKANPKMTTAAGLGLAGVLLGTKTGRGLVKLGGVAAVGGLAYKAYKDWQANQGNGGQDHGGKGGGAIAPKELAPPPSGSAFDHSGADSQERSLAYLTAMIAAAKADGHIDGFEQERIFAKVNELAADSEARAFLMNEMMAPLDIEKITRLAHSQESAVEVYTASAMAILIDTPEEREYMNTLADRLGIERNLARMIENAVAEERQAV